MYEIKNIIKYYLIDPLEFESVIVKRLKEIYGIYYVSGVSNYEVSKKLSNESDIYDIILSLKTDSVYVSIGNINITNDCINLNIDSFFIKRHLFNTIDINIKDSKFKFFKSNLNYILSLNDGIIDKLNKNALLTKNHECYIEEFKLTSFFNFIINKKNNKISLDYKLKLEEGLYGNKFFYVSLSDNPLFKRILNNSLSEKYTLDRFGKKLDKLNKKEQELLKILLY